MKARDAALKLKRFEAEEKSRKVSDLEHMIREFEQMSLDLDRQVQVEEERTGIKDSAHFSYSTFAKAAALRRDNLKTSIADLRAKLEVAMRERDDAQAEVARAGAPEGRDRDGRRRVDRSANAAMR
jgi:hypothetical protein